MISEGVHRFHVGDRMSEMAIHHGTVYLAGQVAEDASLDVRGQARQVLAAVDKLLHEAGTDNAHILRAEIYLADMADFAAMNEIWDDWVAGVEDRDRRHCGPLDRVGSVTAAGAHR